MKNGIQRLIDRLPLWGFLIGLVAAIILSAYLYYFMENQCSSSGLSPIEGITFSNALYFSTITITGLGYGDLKPVGYAKLIAALEVIFGLLLFGLVVAKLASQAGAQLRKTLVRVQGTWIDTVYRNNEATRLGCLHIFLSDDGMTLKLSGEDFDKHLNLVGSFTAKTIDIEWPRLRFYYENNSDADGLSSGVLDICFCPEETSPLYSGVIRDYKSKEPDILQGWRPTEEERKLLLCARSKRATLREMFEATRAQERESEKGEKEADEAQSS